jgi:hypothetical protein
MQQTIRTRLVVRVVGPNQGGLTLVRSHWIELWLATDLIPFDLRRTGSILVMVEREPDQAAPGASRWLIERPAAGETPTEASSFVRPLRRPHER